MSIIISLAIHPLLFPTAPGSPPTSVRVEAAGPTRVQVTWGPPRIPNGIITHYNLYINNNPIQVTPDLRGEADTETYVFTTDQILEPYKNVTVQISAETKAGEGLLSYPQSVVTDESGLCIFFVSFLDAREFHLSYTHSSCMCMCVCIVCVYCVCACVCIVCVYCVCACVCIVCVYCVCVLCVYCVCVLCVWMCVDVCGCVCMCVYCVCIVCVHVCVLCVCMCVYCVYCVCVLCVCIVCVYCVCIVCACCVCACCVCIVCVDA